MNQTGRVEYKFLKFSNHNDAEKSLNEWVGQRWQFVAYQASGESFITHFLVLSRDQASQRSIGFR